MKIKISVTQEHLKNDHAGNPFQCPVALACREAGIKNAGVGNKDVTWGTIASRKKAILPRSARRFITKFDTNISPSSRSTSLWRSLMEIDSLVEQILETVYSAATTHDDPRVQEEVVRIDLRNLIDDFVLTPVEEDKDY